MPVLLDALRPILAGRWSDAGNAAIHHLGRIAAPAARPALEKILARPVRLIGPHTGDAGYAHRIGSGPGRALADEALVTDAVVARDAILSRV
ncbi:MULTISPECIES: hypothetical protein [Catenuloplanes]|uniref:Uncharacterized protein n=1 Tax=Catenuloplanes niger TaxID=587534 RepID=A0AAE4CRU8_9ACTN|nr:hypothetical protein [Catenuloplanes niger]MDR7321897.1 hypothetical protein [Catenuloplanes niger]